jgi:hypothetical protein
MAGGPTLAEVNCTSAPNNTYPRMKVTMCWIDADIDNPDVTKTWIGESFTNGESKIICPDTFIQTSAQIVWRWFGFNVNNSIALTYQTFSGGQAKVEVEGTSGDVNFRLFKGASYGNNPLNISNNIANSDPAQGTEFIPANTIGVLDSRFFGFLLTNDDVTIKWEPISGSGQSWNSWSATDLGGLYATITTDASCP